MEAEPEEESSILLMDEFSVTNFDFEGCNKSDQEPQPINCSTSHPATFNNADPTAHIKTTQPVYLKCPHCSSFTLTRIQHRPGIKSALSCLAVSLVAWCGCCLVPCWMRSCQDTIHCCGHCDRVIAVLERKVIF